MAILKNVEIWHARLDKPNTNFTKDGTWEVQIRTTDSAKKDELVAMGIKMKLALDKDGEPLLMDGKKYWKSNLKKKAKKADGTKVAPVDLVDGHRNPLDPKSVGNGSIGNVRVFQYEYEKAGKKETASILMAVQLTKHIVYVPKPFEEFDETETETIDPPEPDEEAPF